LNRVDEAVKYALKRLQSAAEALKMAQTLRERKSLDEAVHIGEHGLTLDGDKATLALWLAPVEEARGRGAQALAAWLAAFRERPQLEVYKSIQRLAGESWSELQAELKSQAAKLYSPTPLIEIELYEENWDEAIKLADGRNSRYTDVELVADAVLARRPEWVMKACTREAESLLVEANSQNYPHAANWLKRVKKAYTNLGKQREWNDYLNALKEKHRRRYRLIEHLNQL
jgi:uncharacterized Zn finger protein